MSSEEENGCLTHSSLTSNGAIGPVMIKILHNLDIPGGQSIVLVRKTKVCYFYQ